MSAAPKICAYCNGADPDCGFCDNGKPLDTQEDWDRSWGRILDPRLPSQANETIEP